MPKIAVSPNVKFDPEAELTFKKGEVESEANMTKIYKQMQKDGGFDVRPKDDQNFEFQLDPTAMRNWSFVGEENLYN